MMKRQNYRKPLTVLLTLFLFVIAFFGGQSILFAFADTADSTGALADLQKDSKFNIAYYPDNPIDYSIQIIQIAESTSGELCVYTYQPCQKTTYLVATSINMSLTDKMGGVVDSELTDEDKPKLYSLELANTVGVIGKYKVIDFKVEEADVRYYNIASIFRAWDRHIDSQPGNDNTVSEKAYAVGQLWTASTTDDGNVTYDCKEVEVVQVTSQMISFHRYKDGYAWSGIECCDAHYITFSCDHKIDVLLSADVSFYTQSYEISRGEKKLGDDKTEHFKTVNSTDKGDSKKESWQRLSSTADFIADMEITGEEKENLSKYDWIINFYETEFLLGTKWEDVIFKPLLVVDELLAILNDDESYVYNVSGTFVSDVTLMRLEFEYEGEIYNLGVVSDKQTGSGDPSNPVAGIFDNVPWWVWLIIGLVIVAIAVPVLSFFFPVVGTVFKAVFKGLWWVICSPFKLIANAVKNHKNKPGNKSKKRSKTKGKKRSNKRSKNK